MTELDSILKSRDITLPANVHLVKAMVFQVVMYGCESWTIKKTEHRRIDAFELWWWRRLLHLPWTARRSNQSILKKISPEYSLEGLMLKLKLQYFGHLVRRTDSLELRKIEDRRRRAQTGWDGWMTSLTWLTCVWASSGSWWWTGKPGVLQCIGLQRIGHFSSLSDWTELEAELSPCSKAALFFLDLSSLILASPPSLISKCLNLLFGTQAKWWKLKPVSYKQEMKKKRNGVCRKATISRSPTGWCCISIFLPSFWSGLLRYS